MQENDSFHDADASPVKLGAAPTIGREGELAQIRRLVQDAAQGSPGLLFLTGESGIGKSRLLAEAMQVMQEFGGIAALGCCREERGATPYAPWIDAVTTLDEQLRQRNHADTASPPDDLAPVLQGGMHNRGGVTVAGAAEQRAFRTQVTFTRALGKTAAAVPVLIAFDDMQWSDPASNQLLRAVATALTAFPIAIVGAYRTEGPSQNRDLWRTLEEIEERRGSITLPLAPITEEATYHLVERLLGRPALALSKGINRQSGGNPFAIEEIARAIAADDRLAGAMLAPTWTLEPGGVLAILRRRLDQLDPVSRDLLDIAALTGRNFSIDLVRRISGQSPGRLVPLFDAAGQAGLIEFVPGQPDRTYRFRHDQVRDAVVAGITPGRKRALHARIATAVQASDQIDSRLERPALLLHHLLLAGAAEQAAAAADQLGHEAMQVHAFEEAAGAFATSLDLRRAAAGGVSASHEARLLLSRGEALVAASAPEAVAVLVEAEQCAKTAGDPVMTGRAQFRRGLAHARRSEHAPAAQAFRSAIASFASAGRQHRESVLAGVELAETLGAGLGEYREAIETGERALRDVTGHTADPALEAAVRLVLAKTLMRSGNLASGHAQLVPALGQALEAGTFDLAAEISGMLASHAYLTGQLELSERWARTRRDYAVQAGDPFAMRDVRSWLATIAVARGDWMVARGLIAEAATDVTPIDRPEAAAFLNQLSGIIALTLGQLDDAVACFELATAGFRQAGEAPPPWYLGTLAHARQAAGDHDTAIRAVREAERAVATLPAGSLPLAPVLAQLGLVAVLLLDDVSARRLYRSLLAYRGQFHWVLIDRVLGMLARTFGDLDAADAHLADAAPQALQGGMRPEHALTMAGRAFAAARATDSERTRDELEQAVARLRALGMEGAIRRLEMLTGIGRVQPPGGIDRPRAGGIAAGGPETDEP